MVASLFMPGEARHGAGLPSEPRGVEEGVGAEQGGNVRVVAQPTVDVRREPRLSEAGDEPAAARVLDAVGRETFQLRRAEVLDGGRAEDRQPVDAGQASADLDADPLPT